MACLTKARWETGFVQQPKMYNKREKTDLSLCIKKRMSSANIKDSAETRTNGDKNPVHTYIVNQKKSF